MVNFASI